MNKIYKSIIGVSYALLVIKDSESDTLLDYIKKETYDISPNRDDVQIQINDVVIANLEIVISEEEEQISYQLLFHGEILAPSKSITMGDLIDPSIQISLPSDVVTLSVYRVEFDEEQQMESLLIQVRVNPYDVNVDLEYED